MDRKQLEQLLCDFQPFNEVLSKKDLLDELVISYIGGNTVSVSKLESECVERMIKRDDIVGLAVWFHEAYECLVHLQRYSTEEIVSGKAHKEFYEQAHLEAIQKEFGLYDHLCSRVQGKKLPWICYALASPVNELHVELLKELRPEWEIEMSVYPERLDVITNKLGFLEIDNPDQVDVAINLFEKLGYNYKDKEKIRSAALLYLKSQIDKS